MANKKTNKFANKAAEVKTEPAVEVKAEETPVAAPAAEAPKAEAPAEKKAPAKKPAVKKEAVKEEKTVVKAEKPAAAKTEKPAAKKAAPEKSAKLFVEFNGNQYNSEEIIEKCKAAYKGDSKKQVKTIEVYVNVSENKAYYVINGKSGENYYIDL